MDTLGRLKVRTTVDLRLLLWSNRIQSKNVQNIGKVVGKVESDTDLLVCLNLINKTSNVIPLV